VFKQASARFKARYGSTPLKETGGGIMPSCIFLQGLVKKKRISLNYTHTHTHTHTPHTPWSETNNWFTTNTTRAPGCLDPWYTHTHTHTHTNTHILSPRCLLTGYAELVQRRGGPCEAPDHDCPTAFGLPHPRPHAARARGACTFGTAHPGTQMAESCLLFITKKCCSEGARCEY